MPWPRTSETTSPVDPALPEYLRAQADDLTDVLAGHIDRDNVEAATLLSTSFAVGATSKVTVKEPTTTSSTGADLRDGLLLFDEALFGSTGAFLAFTSSDSVVVVSAKAVLRFIPVAAGALGDHGWIVGGVMVDGVVVARTDRFRVMVDSTAGGAESAHSFIVEGAIAVPAGAHRALVFVELDEWSGAHIGTLQLGERFIMIEEMVR